MLIRKKLGTLSAFDMHERPIDRLPLEWHECSRRILHKRTAAGTEMILKFLGENHRLEEDDVLYADAQTIIAVEIIPCEVILLAPSSVYEAAVVCYEIGNKHLPLFYDEGQLLLPYDAPVFRLLQAMGMNPETAEKKLVHPLRTTVLPHRHADAGSLFSRILKLTAHE